MPTERNIKAAFATEGTFTYPELFAGEAEIITSSMPLAANTALAANTVLSLNTSGNLVPLDPAQTDGRQIPVCINCEAIVSSASVKNIAVYVAGFFNHEALVWPAGTAVDTLTERRNVFARTPIQIGELKAIRAPG